MYKFFCAPLLLFLFIFSGVAQEPDPVDIIKKSEDKLRGESTRAEVTMTIVRPDWSREMKMKMWSKGTEYSMILITAPARDEGTAFLKRQKELWNWLPKIERRIKLRSSAMGQSWMGSDFTNDDLVRESSTILDYTHRYMGEEEISGRNCHKLELIPKEEAPVVWGKVLMWVDTKDYMQLKVEFYDEDDFLVNTMLGSDIQEFSGILLPAKMEMIPSEKEGHKTIIQYSSLVFDEPIEETFFSVQNMQRLQ
ncbi:MAG: outer membrane lipoprotein-sorting protein [Bacteroidetes bacterium]|nr:outer membrane lipoprotein-sorting protein [Bacteroidota bacterium]